MSQSTEDQILEIIAGIKGSSGTKIAPETSFFQDNLLDSIDFLELISACEQTFGVTIDLLETEIQHISSLAGLAGFINSSQTIHE
jgi:acyl carrier protein